MTPGDWPANFEKVDSRVWRGAAPTAERGWLLANQGVRTVVNLEWEASDAQAFAGTHVNLVRVRDFEPLPWIAPSLADEHVVRALAAIRKGPPIVYVHCRSGQNRTGVVIAAYRILMRSDPPGAAITDFKRFRGLWAWGDALYLGGLYARRADLMKRVSAVTSPAT